MTTETRLPPAMEQHQDLVTNLRSMAQHLAGDASDVMSKTAASLAHAAADLVEQGRKEAGPVIRRAGKEIKDHPVSTVAIVAASLGLIGYALSRNGKAEP